METVSLHNFNLKQAFQKICIGTVIAFLIFELLMRLITIFFHDSIWYDQALYCHEAQKLLNMKWSYINNNANNFYTLQKSGLSIYNPPLYPMSIAFLSLLVRNIEVSAIIISFASNILTLYLVYWISNRLLDTIWALGITAVCASATLTISVTAYAECLYMLFLAIAVYMLLQFYHRNPVIFLIGSSFMLGCAYLTKPEAITLFPVFVFYTGALLPWKTPGTVKNNIIRLLVFVFVFIATIFPYSFYLKTATGYWESKKFVYSLIAAERLEGMDFGRAYWEMNKDNTDTILSERTETERIVSLVRRDFTSLVQRSMTHSYMILNMLLAYSLATRTLFFKLQAILFLLVVSVTFIIAVRKRKGFYYFIAAILFFVFQLIPISVMVFLLRPILPLVPVTLIVFAFSLKQVCDYIKESAVSYPISEMFVLTVTCWLFVASIFNYPHELRYQKSFTCFKEVGTWLNQKISRDDVVMVRDPQVAYYAGSEQCILPAGNEEAIFRYGKLKNAKYLVIYEERREIKNKIFSLVKEFDSPRGKVEVYKLR